MKFDIIYALLSKYLWVSHPLSGNIPSQQAYAHPHLRFFLPFQGVLRAIPLVNLCISNSTFNFQLEHQTSSAVTVTDLGYYWQEP